MVKGYVKPREGILLKVDEVFHRLFFQNRFDTPLEVIVKDGFKGESHRFAVRGNYMGERRKPAFHSMLDEVSLPIEQPLEGHYLTALQCSLNQRDYDVQKKERRLVVKPKVTRAEIEKTIREYMLRLNNSPLLDSRQFIELTGASEADCVNIGEESAPLHLKRFSTHDVLNYSRAAFTEKNIKGARFRNPAFPERPAYHDFWETRYARVANIMQIYRKARGQAQQTSLF